MTVLIKYEAACRSLAEAHRIDEVKDIRDKAEAMRVYGIQSKNSDLEKMAFDIRERAERRLGELIVAAKKTGEIAEGRPWPKNNCSSEEQLPNRIKLADLGVDRKLSARSQRKASISERAFEAGVARAKDQIEQGHRVAFTTEEKQERRANRERKLSEKISSGNLDLPKQKFGLILADPAWGRTVYSQSTGMDRHASNHYTTPTGDEATQDDSIKALPVASIAAKDCVLGLWCTDPHRGVDVMRAWEFEPKSYCVWIKDIIPPIEVDPLSMFKTGTRFQAVGIAGTGFWFRDRCEILLIGVRGKPVCPAPGTQGESVWFARRGEHASKRDEVHSDKPECSFLWFERHWPNTPKIELNHRGPLRPGWVAWGFEADASAAEDEAMGATSEAAP